MHIRQRTLKSALPDAARDPSRLSLVLQTAPLCPTNVPIQSPVHSRSIGFPSLQLDMSRYVPSSRRGEKERWVTGRVCPGATSGTALCGADMAARDRSKKKKGSWKGREAKKGDVVIERRMAGALRADGRQRRKTGGDHQSERNKLLKLIAQRHASTAIHVLHVVPPSTLLLRLNLLLNLLTSR